LLPDEENQLNTITEESKEERNSVFISSEGWNDYEVSSQSSNTKKWNELIDLAASNKI
jgi:hypothetical protein